MVLYSRCKRDEQKEKEMTKAEKRALRIRGIMMQDKMLFPFINNFDVYFMHLKDPAKALELLLPDYIPGQKIAAILKETA